MNKAAILKVIDRLLDMNTVESDTLQDIRGAELVDVMIRSDGKTMWVNVEGVCMLRITGIQTLVIRDERTYNDSKTNASSS